MTATTFPPTNRIAKALAGYPHERISITALSAGDVVYFGNSTDQACQVDVATAVHHDRPKGTAVKTSKPYVYVTWALRGELSYAPGVKCDLFLDEEGVLADGVNATLLEQNDYEGTGTMVVDQARVDAIAAELEAGLAAKADDVVLTDELTAALEAEAAKPINAKVIEAAAAKPARSTCDPGCDCSECVPPAKAKRTPKDPAAPKAERKPTLRATVWNDPMVAVQAYELRKSGLKYPEVAAELGWTNIGHVRRACVLGASILGETLAVSHRSTAEAARVAAFHERAATVYEGKGFDLPNGPGTEDD